MGHSIHFESVAMELKKRLTSRDTGCLIALLCSVLPACTVGGRWQVNERSIKLKLLNTRTSPLLLSPDNRHLAYASIPSPGETQNAILMDGEPVGTYDEINGFIFSPDSRRFAYAARRGENQIVVVDGKESPPYEDVSGLLFSPDSRRFVYCAERGHDEHVVIDGVESPPFRFIWEHPVFSPDSSRVAFCVQTKDGKTALVVDDDVRKGDFKIGSYTIRFTPDSKQLIYSMQRADGWYLVFGEREYGPFDEADGVLLAVSPDSKRVAFPVKDGSDRYLVTNDERYGPYSWVLPVFSPDSLHLAYSARTNATEAVYLDGRRLGSLPDIAELSFSPDGESLLIHASTGLQIVDVQSGNITEGHALSIAWSPDSRKVARVAATESGFFVESDGQAGPEYDEIQQVYFSPDSEHVCYWAMSGRESILVVDTEEALRFTGWALSPPVFDGDSICVAGIRAVSNDAYFVPEYDWDAVKKWIEITRIVLFELKRTN